MSSTNPKTYAAVTSHKVAFLGLGVMGHPMAGHLALAGHQVTVYNRSPAKATAWCAEFVSTAAPRQAATPRQAAAGADIAAADTPNFSSIALTSSLSSITDMLSREVRNASLSNAILGS